MAGDWIKFEIATSDKPEVWEIANNLNLDPDAVVGKLLRVWAWFDQQTEKGNAPSVTKMLLDRNVGVTGFCDSLIKAGWMVEDAGFITLPHFDRHNGKTAKNRALTAKRVASHKSKTNAEGNGEVTVDALPREEKRREDINIYIETDVSTDPPPESKIKDPPQINGDDKNHSSHECPPPCPHLKIIELYHEILPELPRVLASRWPNSTRSKALKARWDEDAKHQSLEFWRRYFTGIRKIDFYFSGVGSGEYVNWSANLGWLVKRENFDKTVERLINLNNRKPNHGK